MASTSNIKKLTNEMSLFEEQSDRYIPGDKYYVINITCDTKDSLRKISQTLLTHELQPLVSYLFGSSISLVYSSVGDGQAHNLSGSHHKIISVFCSEITLELGCSVRCSIVEFDSRTQVTSYFLWKVHNNSMLCLISKSKKKISVSDTKNKTFTELLETLNSNGVVWQNIPKEDRYGTFFKLRRKKTVTVVTFSEASDAREMKKYSSFIFE